MPENTKNKKYDYSQIDKKVEKIIKIASSYMINLDKVFIDEEIKKSYIFARDAHEWQFRLSWDPYIVHPVESTIELLSLRPDIVSIQSCLLHDVIEDTPRTFNDIKKNFWEEVSQIAAWMEKLSKVRYRQEEERNIWSLRKMFVAMADDIRVILVKLADRLHNMKTLKYHPKPEKQLRIALETINIYAPIAYRLWLFNLKNDLEKECFKILNPREYSRIRRELSSLKKTNEAFMANAKIEIDQLLELVNIQYELEFRVKSVYSIYKKLNTKWYERVSDLYDIYWIRIITENQTDCYRTLWEIHNKWNPIPRKIKDYIATPKQNGYQSLHTTVIWLLSHYRKQPTEIQIRTRDMHKHAEYWIAAHFSYKEKWNKIDAEINWVKELKDITTRFSNQDFMTSLKLDMFKDRIFVFTPKWDPINLPIWSTPIDFAYEIHTYLWNHVSIAKVNTEIYPLDKELKNGDIVEIIIDKHRKPNPTWLSFIKTAKAKAGIRAILNIENKKILQERWKQIINKYLEKIWLDQFDKDLTVLSHLDDRAYSYDQRLWILEQIGSYNQTPSSLIKRILKAQKIKKSLLPVEKGNKVKKIPSTKPSKSPKSDIIIWDQKGIIYRLWKCCSPRIGDKIIAYMTSKSNATIHTYSCPSVKNSNSDRFMPAYYEDEWKKTIIVDVSFLFSDKIWILKTLSWILFDMNIDTIEISSSRKWIDKMDIVLKLEFNEYDLELIDRFIERVQINTWKDLLSFHLAKIEG